MDYRRKDPLDYKDILENLKDPAWYDLEDPDAPLTDDAAFALEDLMRRVEEEEQRCKELEEHCKRLDEARERANDAAAKWEGMYRMALERADMAEETASDLCDDFTDFVTGGVHNAAPYCANRRPECVNAHGWCDGDNRVCRGFMPKAAVRKKEE